MKKLITMIALGLTITGTTYAQSNPHDSKNNNRSEQSTPDKGSQDYDSPERIASRDTDDFSRKYNLNQGQKKKLNAYNLKLEREKQSWQKRNGHDRVAMQKFEREMEQKRERELRSILTPKQLEHYSGQHS